MTRQELGKKAKTLRGETSKYSIVNSTKLTFAQIGQIEKGDKNYTIDTLLIYLNALGLKIEVK